MSHYDHEFDVRCPEIDNSTPASTMVPMTDVARVTPRERYLQRPPAMITSALHLGAVLPSTYDPHLVALSVAVASIAAYAALTLAERVTAAQGRLKALWLLTGATAMGSGIWSMHFTGMLAFSLPVPISYNVPLVALSLVAAIAASAVALSFVTRHNLPLRLWLIGGLLMGIGVSVMHFTGMAAMDMAAMIQWDMRVVVLAGLIAVAVSLVALWLVFKLQAVASGHGERLRLAAAGIMGVAVAGMHYTGMAAATFTYMAMPLPTGMTVSAATLGGGAIALITVLILSLALAVAFIDRRFAAQDQALLESKHHFRMVVANVPVILFALDAAGVVTLAQGRGLTALGHTADDVMGRSFFDLYYDVPDLMQQAHRALAGEEHTAVSTVRDVVLETRWTPVQDERNQIMGAIAVATDITERHRAEAALQHQALYDALTNLPNRTLLGEHLTLSVQKAQSAGETFALLLIDLNRFKDVNDTLGHHAGDALLCQVGLRLQETLRPADLPARLGGDEFAVLLPEATVSTAVAVAQRLLVALTTPMIVEGQMLEIGASLGIAVYPEHGTDAATLMRHADVAMYVAKRRGDGQTVYDPTQDEHSPTRLTMERELRQAIAGGILVLHYQPKLNLATNQICGVEALVRWPQSSGGLIMPDTFIPLAEQSGLIGPLTQWVMEEALRQLQIWDKQGLCLDVSVNLSTQILRDPTLPETVAWLLQRFAIAPERLTLEVTESMLMSDPTQARAILMRLAALGVTLAIDDFGTGYSSFSYLMDVPVTEIKIDKSFVLAMESNDKNRVIIGLVSDMAHQLGLQIVAEGVETEAALHTVRALGCGVAQGYHLSRPLPAQDLEHWMSISPWGQSSAAPTRSTQGRARAG